MIGIHPARDGGSPGTQRRCSAQKRRGLCGSAGVPRGPGLLAGPRETLRAMRVHVLYGEGGFVPNELGQGRPDAYPWHLALEAAEQAANARS